LDADAGARRFLHNLGGEEARVDLGPSRGPRRARWWRCSPTGPTISRPPASAAWPWARAATAGSACGAADPFSLAAAGGGPGWGELLSPPLAGGPVDGLVAVRHARRAEPVARPAGAGLGVDLVHPPHALG